VVRVASTNFSEQVTLAELYSLMLEAHGYAVERHFNLGNREVVAPALESGQVDVYVEYLATMLRYLDRDARPSSDARETHRALQSALSRRGLAVLAYAPAVDTNAFAVTRSTAAQFGLSKLSDLEPIADQMVLGGPPECTLRPFCLPGLQDTYGLRFKAFKPLDALGPLTVAALDNGQIDVGLFGSTDGVVAQKGFVVLEDDRHLQLADNVAPVIRADVLAKVPADFPELMDRVSGQLTTRDLIELNTTVDVERQPVRDVALAWLRSKGLVR
jgi:osmoprotectant transport system substrate-binding protein